LAHHAIDDISVSLDDGTLDIEMVPGVEITEEEIRELVEDAGYEVVGIEWRTEGS
jgi:copper chaperone CopZ